MARTRGTTAQRGYDAKHKRERARVAVLVDRGQALCSRCRRLIVPGTPWDLDHTDDRAGYRGAAHRYCNRAAGARLGNAGKSRRRAIVERLVTSRSW